MFHLFLRLNQTDFVLCLGWFFYTFDPMRLKIADRNQSRKWCCNHSKIPGNVMIPEFWCGLWYVFSSAIIGKLHFLKKIKITDARLTQLRLETNQNRCIIHNNSLDGFSFFLLLLIRNRLIIMFGDPFNGHIFQQYYHTKPKIRKKKNGMTNSVLMALPKCWNEISFLDVRLVNVIRTSSSKWKISSNLHMYIWDKRH